MLTWYDFYGVIQTLFWFLAALLVLGCIAAVTASYGWRRAIVYLLISAGVAFVCSLHDVAWPEECPPEEWPCDCTPYVLTEREDGDTLYVRVGRLPIEYPTDLHVERFAGCVRKLLFNHARETGRHGTVVLTNEGWVPSLWRVIDVATAHFLVTGQWETFDGMTSYGEEDIADALALTWDDEELED